MTRTNRLRTPLAGLLLLLAPALAGAQNLPPAVEFETPAVDFGDVRPGSVVTAEVLLHNRTMSPVRLRSVRPSCPCTEASTDQTQIPPGSAIPVRVRFEPDRHGMLGAIDGRVVVRFLERRDVLALAYTAHVNHGVRWTRTPGGYRLRSTDDAPFTIRTIDGSSPTNPALATPAPSHTLADDVLRPAGPDPTPGPDRAGRRWIVVETDHPGAPALVLAANPDAEVAAGSWLPDPAVALLDPLPPGGETELVVQLHGARAPLPPAGLTLIEHARLDSPDGLTLLPVGVGRDDLIPKLRLLVRAPDRLPPGRRVARADLELTINGLTRRVTVVAPFELPPNTGAGETPTPAQPRPAQPRDK